MGSTNHKSSRSLSASNIFPSFATPENTKFHFEKLKQPKMASNSINFSKINSKPAQTNANSLHLKNVDQIKGKKTFSSIHLKEKPENFVKKLNFNEFLNNAEKVDNIFVKAPNRESPSSSKDLLLKKKKSIVELNTNRTYTSKQNRKKNSENDELQQFVKNYSEKINLRRFSSDFQKKSKKNLINSPLIKDHKNNENNFDEYDLKSFGTNSQKPKKEHMSPFKNKIKMLVHNFKHKKQSTIENSYDPHNKFTKKTFEPKALSDLNRLNWNEIDIPLSINREMLEEATREEQNLLEDFNPSKKCKTSQREYTKEPSLHDSFQKNMSEKKKFKTIKLKNPQNSVLTNDLNLNFKRTTSKKIDLLESSLPTLKFQYPTNLNNGICITIYSENTEKMQKKLLQTMEFDKLVNGNNLKLAKGQIKYVKNGRVYVYNLNEHVIIHKDKILQIDNTSRNDMQKKNVKDDLFNYLIRKKVSPTEYFCNKVKQKKLKSTFTINKNLFQVL